MMNRLLDLFSTLEASVLYERLYTLPAQLPVVGEELVLRDHLIETGVLRELDMVDAHPRIAQLILDGLARIENPVEVAGSASTIGTPIDYEARVRGEIEEFLESNPATLREATAKQLRSWYPGLVPTEAEISRSLPPNIFDTHSFELLGGRSTEILEAADIGEFGRNLIGWIEYHGSGAYEFCTSVLRDMYYVFAAEERGVPFWPDVTRVEFARRFPNFMDRGSRTKLFMRFAKELGTSVDQVSEVFGRNIFFIPPFSAMVLDKSERPSEIPKALSEVRREFMWLRHDMEELDGEMQNADSFGKMQKVAQKQGRLSQAIADRFSGANSVWIERGFKYVPELSRPAMAPLDPSKYGPGLLLQPIEWLIDAFRKRPVAFFFDAKKKVDNIRDYQGLVPKVFGNIDLNSNSPRWL
jgi:hypothetical protein